MLFNFGEWSKYIANDYDFKENNNKINKMSDTTPISNILGSVRKKRRLNSTSSKNSDPSIIKKNKNKKKIN